MQLPDAVPVMTLPSATLFPQALLPLYIFEPRYRRMLKDMLAKDRVFAVAMQRPGRVREIPCAVAGLGLIRVAVGHDDGTSHLILQGLTRVKLGEAVQYKPYRMHRIEPLVPEQKSDTAGVDALLAKVHELVEQRLDIAPFPSPFPVKKSETSEPAPPTVFSKTEVMKYLSKLPGADQVADLVTCALLSDANERQTILETVAIDERLKHLIHFLMAEITRRQNDSAK
jgi:ATP-dependent Lon protease